MPQSGNEKKTQKAVLATKLIELKEDVTEKDRKEAIVELDLTKVTIGNYLNGNVNDNDTAVRIIKFFTKCIEKRYKAIA